MSDAPEADVPSTVEDTVRSALDEQDLEWEDIGDGVFAVALPGEKRLKTACILTVGVHALEVEAFVMRAPDENREQVYGWLLQRNTRMYGVSWAIDGAGDVYLTGRMSLSSVTADEIDRILGSVLEYSDGSFNVLLEMGFGTSIRREWAWRVKNDLPRANLAAFEEFAKRPDEHSAKRSAD